MIRGTGDETSLTNSQTLNDCGAGCLIEPARTLELLVGHFW